MKFSRRPRRGGAEVNASSMADIAFLLLIFFLVTTTIVIDQGIAVKLPPWSEIPPEAQSVADRNLFRVVVNSSDQLLIENEQDRISNLREKAIEFITNPNQLSSLAKNPKNAVISLQNDRSTSYEMYLMVYNELKAAYNEIWNEEALSRFGYKYKDLEREQQKEIQRDIPLVISEAEPTDLISQR